MSAVATAEPAELSPSLEERAIAAVAAGQHRIVIPAATYRLPNHAGRPSIRLREIRDLEIDASGVTFVATSLDQTPLLLERCHRITLRGFTLEHAALPYSQGVIQELAADRRSFTVQVDAGYPTRFTDGSIAMRPPFYPFDRASRQWKAGDLYPQRVEPTGTNTFRVVMPAPIPPEADVAAGEPVAWRGQLGDDIRLEECAEMSLVDVTIRGGRGFCVHESGGDGGNTYRFTVTYPAPPPGSKERPLIAANADAFHSNGVRHGPTLDGCRFEGMPDDGVAIHGQYALVMEMEADHVIIDSRAVAWRPGDAAEFVSTGGDQRGHANVRSAEVLTSYVPAEPTQRRGFTAPAQGNFVRLQLDGTVAVRRGDLVANANAVGSGFVVRHCVIQNHRARGMLLRASNGIVEDNVLAGCTMAGIVVAPEIDYWNEAGYAHDLLIQRNVIRCVGTTLQPWNPMAGALTIGAYEEKRFVPRPGGHRQIVVRDNVFEDNDGANVLVTSARDVTLAGNRFVRPMRRASSRGADRSIVDGALIQIRASDGVRLEANTLVEPGAALRETTRVEDSLSVDLRHAFSPP